MLPLVGLTFHKRPEVFARKGFEDFVALAWLQRGATSLSKQQLPYRNIRTSFRSQGMSYWAKQNSLANFHGPLW